MQVGDRLEEHLRARARKGQPLSDEDADAFKAELAHRVVEDYARDQAERGTGRVVGGAPRTWSPP